ncbi:hypothetical protein [Parafrankia sp. BMG5.11]|uniref:hypothetical protein n=1 Tax=Parafrankia sp. BMG5.11 TaxID=222540 RepID=UPI0010D61AD3|nr:hypothetical protein [Parafrankia sp. BMG5.11]TCJ38825.1 hypothetical protein E0504_10930 [Parafrankia sp. BMG5.11]
MSAHVLTLPAAVRLGFTHVCVAPVSSGWAAMMWAKTGGPYGLSAALDYEGAVDRARAYVAVDPATRVLDVPAGQGEMDGRGLVHVDRRDDGCLEVTQESASGNSFALLRRYRAPDRKRAMLFAVEVLAQYTNGKGQPSRLGRVPL